jgi:hypothetical protein
MQQGSLRAIPQPTQLHASGVTLTAVSCEFLICHSGTCSSSLLTKSSSQAVELSSGAWFVATNSATELMKAVNRQPIVIYFSVQSGFQNYAGGVYSPSLTECQLTVNHAGK